MICDNCLNWYSCKKENHEDRPIQEFDNGDVWCGRRITYQQVKAKWNLEYLLQKQKLIEGFIKKIDYFLFSDDCEPIEYFIKIKEEYKKSL